MNITRDHHNRIRYRFIELQRQSTRFICMFTRMTWLFPKYQSDSMHHARDVCKEICNRMILHFSYYCKYGVLVFGDDGTGPADESERTKRVQGWSRQIMGGGFCYLQYYYFVK